MTGNKHDAIKSSEVVELVNIIEKVRYGDGNEKR